MNSIGRLVTCAFLLPLLALCSCAVNNKHVDTDYERGVKNYSAGRFVEASNDFSAAIAQRTNFMWAYFYRGDALAKCTNYDLAIEDYGKVIELNPREAEAYFDRGLVLYFERQYSAAITNFDKAIQLKPSKFAFYMLRGVDRSCLRDWEGALEDLNLAQKKAPFSRDVYMSRASVLVSTKDFEKADADATQAVWYNHEDANSFYPYYVRGRARFGLADFKNALADLDAANQLKPHQSEVLAQRCIVKAVAGDLKGAEEDLEAAAVISPRNEEVLRSKALLKKMSDELPGALSECLKLVELNPQWPEYFELLGTIQNDLSQYSDALQSFRTATKMDPRLYYPHFRVWLIRARMGERDEATRELSASMKAREQDKGHKWESCIGRFLTGQITESNLFAQADKTAIHAKDIPALRCEAQYYAGMKRLLDGDKSGAATLFEKCVASGLRNYAEYGSAKAELEKLNKP
jgi:tetratricopeptide (TPR) repeat protein